jgi:FKBP-type peptidyl-prolyl cis-trans isomerase
MTQRKLNLRSLVIAGIGMVLLSACMKSRHEGFEESETGLYYAIHKESGATKTPKEGDILWCKMQLLLKGADGKKDSMLYDSEDAPDFPGGIKFIQYVKPEYEGDLMEGVSKLHIGDSASFIVSADSFFLVSNKMDTIPKGIKPGSELLFRFGIKDIKTKEETIKMISEAQSSKSGIDKAKLDELQASEAADLQAYLDKKKITAKPNPSGLVYVEVEKGNGKKAQKGQKVTLNYTGYLLNGKKFDSSFDHGQPFEFTLGKGEVIAGWDEGVAMMNVGGTATFVIPSVLGYGSNGAGGDIPPFAPLVFEVQLLKAQ